MRQGSHRVLILMEKYLGPQQGAAVMHTAVCCWRVLSALCVHYVSAHEHASYCIVGPSRSVMEHFMPHATTYSSLLIQLLGPRSVAHACTYADYMQIHMQILNA
jgi:hypothetical protein